MHNRLIFRYHRVRVHSNPMLLRGCQGFRSLKDPTHIEAESRRGTQEGR
jgi:hypothetical protein